MQNLRSSLPAASDYAYLLGCDRQYLLWEWLRRDPHYRSDDSVIAVVEQNATATRHFDPLCAERWGLMFPDRSCPKRPRRASRVDRRAGGPTTTLCRGTRHPWGHRALPRKAADGRCRPVTRTLLAQFTR